MHSTTRRRRLAAAAALPLIAALALAGCSTPESGGDGGAGSNSGTITIANPGDINDDVVAAFEAKYPDIKVKVQDYDGDTYSEKITSLVAGGQAPDIMILFENDTIRLAKAGSIISLDDYLSSGDLKTADLIPAVGKLADQAGGTYGLPWNYAAQVLYYNKDIFDAAGVDYPTADWTWEDYRKAAIATSSGEGNSKVWGTDAFSFPGMWYSLAGQAGDQVIDGEGNLVLGDGIKHALEFTNELTNVDKVQPQPATSGNAVTDLFAAGKSAMKLDGSWAVATYKDAAFNWDIAPQPKDKVAYTTLHTAFYTISKTSKNQDAAWTFLNWAMSDEGQSITSSLSSNPSAVTRLADSTDWQHPGANGPTDYAAVTDERGAFGYTLAPFSISNDLGAAFNSYLLGATSLDDVMAQVKDKASGK